MSRFGVKELEQILGFAPSSEQAPVILGPLGHPAVIIAGAGSGKTSMMVARMLTLIARGDCGSEQILGLTFTRKAASELAGRLDRALRTAARAGLVPSDLAEPEVSTYHSFAQRVVREHGLRVGIDPDGRVETEFTLRPLAFRSAAALDSLADVEHKYSLGAAAKAIIGLDSELAEHMVSTAVLRDMEERRLAALAQVPKLTAPIRHLMRTSRLRIVVSHGVDDYRQRKLDEGVLDYADLTRFAARIAAESPAAVAALRDQHRAVLLDEYQDTSVVQRRMLQSMFAAGHPVLAVGDPKQSIYGFRGAASANIIDFPEHFPHVDGTASTVFTLSTNFRSGPEILAVANELASGAKMAHGAPLVAGGRVRNSQVEANLFETRDEEEAFVVSHVCAELASGRDPEQLLVLAATNKDVSRIAGSLTAAGVPVTSSDLAGLLSEPVVQDVISYAAVLSNPAANTDLLRLLIGPRWRIGVRDLALLGNRSALLAGLPGGPTDGDLDAQLRSAVEGSDPIDTPALLDAVMDPGDERYSPEALGRFADFAREFSRLGRHVSEPVPEFLLRIIRETGLDVEVLLGEQSGARRAALEALISLSAQWSSANPRGGLGGFLRAVHIARTTELKIDFEPPEGPGRVRVMTVHKAKGLEAEVVVLPGLGARAFDEVVLRGVWITDAAALPHDLRGDLSSPQMILPLDNRALEEHKDSIRAAATAERARLTYVAFTRASERLVVSAHHWTPEVQKAKEPSRHLRAIAETEGVVVRHWVSAPADTNPYGDVDLDVAFPQENSEARRRLQEAADLVLQAQERAARNQAGTAEGTAADPAAGESTAIDGAGADPTAADAAGVDPSTAAQIARWDRDLAALLRERERQRSRELTVLVPETLSVTRAQALVADPRRFALNLRRPMPRPSAAQARLGTRFHEWVAARWSQHPLIDALDWSADAELAEPPTPALEALQKAFEASEFAEREPFAIEYPFTITLAGSPVSGQIDAIYAEGDGWEVVDWKTNTIHDADPLQLAIYRIAWARIKGVPLSQVAASFFYVARSERVTVDDLPDEAQVEHLLTARLGDTA